MNSFNTFNNPCNRHYPHPCDTGRSRGIDIIFLNSYFLNCCKDPSSLCSQSTLLLFTSTSHFSLPWFMLSFENLKKNQEVQGYSYLSIIWRKIIEARISKARRATQLEMPAQEWAGKWFWFWEGHGAAEQVWQETKMGGWRQGKERYFCKDRCQEPAQAIPPMTRSCGRGLINKASGLDGPPGPARASTPETRICLSYYFVPFTNSPDVNRGLSPTTFL